MKLQTRIKKKERQEKKRNERATQIIWANISTEMIKRVRIIHIVIFISQRQTTFILLIIYTHFSDDTNKENRNFSEINISGSS